MLQLPIDAEHPNYKVSTTLDGQQVTFNVRWNGRDNAWYFDLLDVDETPIQSGIRIVLGMLLGHRATSPSRLPGVIRAADLSGEGREATIDDLGSRVVVYYIPAEEL